MMTLEKAIEIQTKTLKVNYQLLDPDFRESLKLDIEAMKELRRFRKYYPLGQYPLLPGETKE